MTTSTENMHIGPTFEFCLYTVIIAPKITELIHNHLFLEVPSLAQVERKSEREVLRKVETGKKEGVGDIRRKERKNISLDNTFHFLIIFILVEC